MIYLGADHGGFELKEKVKVWLTEWGESYQDLGAEVLEEEDDYPEYASKVATRVSLEDKRDMPWKERAKGILLCRSGGGMVIVANKFDRVRAVYVDTVKAVAHARSGNDANVISMAADWVEESIVGEVMRAFLTTEFSGEERHNRRIEMIENLEKKE